MLAFLRCNGNLRLMVRKNAVSANRFFRLLCLLSLVWSIGGCAYLYRAEDDQAAQQAYKAYSDADFAKSLDAERVALTKRQADRQEMVKRSQIALRDASLARIIGGTSGEYTWGALENLIAQRMLFVRGQEQRVVKPDDQCAKSISELRRDHAFNEETVNLARTRLLQSLSAATEKINTLCTTQPTVLPTSLSGNVKVNALAERFDETCKDLAKTQFCIQTIQKSGGELARIVQRLDAIDNEKKGIASQVERLGKAYDDELGKADQAKEKTGDAKKLAQRLQSLLDKFDSVTAEGEALRGNAVISGLIEQASVVKLTKQKEVLEGFVSALSGNEPVKASLDQHRVYLVANLVNRVTEKPTPPTAGIILQTEIYRQQIATSNARIKHAEDAIHLLEQKRIFLVDELDYLEQAQTELREISKSDCDKKKEFFSSIKSPPSSAACSMRATKALLAFANSWTLGKLSQELVDYHLIDQQETAALDESEAALQQTDTVVKAALEQLNKLYASGLKPEQISALIQTLGLSAIAVRVK